MKIDMHSQVASMLLAHRRISAPLLVACDLLASCSDMVLSVGQFGLFDGDSRNDFFTDV